MKNCPFCAEQIKDEATRCRYCKADIPADSADIVTESNRGRPKNSFERALFKFSTWLKYSLQGFTLLQVGIMIFPVLAVTSIMMKGYSNNTMLFSYSLRSLIAVVVILMMHVYRKGHETTRKIIILFFISTLLNHLISNLTVANHMMKRLVEGEIADLIFFDVFIFIPIFIFAFVYSLLRWETTKSSFFIIATTLLTIGFLLSVFNYFTSDPLSPIPYTGGYLRFFARLEIDVILKVLVLFMTIGSIYRRVDINNKESDRVDEDVESLENGENGDPVFQQGGSKILKVWAITQLYLGGCYLVVALIASIGNEDIYLGISGLIVIPWIISTYGILKKLKWGLNLILGYTWVFTVIGMFLGFSWEWVKLIGALNILFATLWWYQYSKSNDSEATDEKVIDA